VFVRLAICSAFCIPNLIRAVPNAVFQRVFHLGYPTEDALSICQEMVS
jgi:hypothetical protein